MWSITELPHLSTAPRSHRTSSSLHTPINVDRVAADLALPRQQRLGEDGFQALVAVTPEASSVPPWVAETSCVNSYDT